MRNCCGNCDWWQAEVVDAATGRAMPEVQIANCRVHLTDTERDECCNKHSGRCNEERAWENG